MEAGRAICLCTIVVEVAVLKQGGHRSRFMRTLDAVRAALGAQLL
jgi:hypothetical protein